MQKTTTTWQPSIAAKLEKGPKVSEYDQEMPHSQTNPGHSEEETQDTDSNNTIKVKQPALSSSARWLLN